MLDSGRSSFESQAGNTGIGFQGPAEIFLFGISNLCAPITTGCNPSFEINRSFEAALPTETST
jgi:hypothetical protein